MKDNRRPVLYYGRPYPREWFEGKGIRARFVLLLHSMWCRIGRWIEYHVMLVIAKRQAFDKSTVKALQHRFHEENQEHLSGRTRRKKGSALAAFGIPDVEWDKEPAEVRYGEGRKNKPTPDPVQQQTDETIDNLARLMAQKRKQSYTQNRDTYLVDEVEAEPVDQNQSKYDIVM